MTDPTPTPMPEDQPAEEKSSHGVLATVLLILFVLFLVLVFWRSCDAGDSEPETVSGGGVIQEVTDLEVAPGGVAIWVKPGVTVQEVLDRNGLSDASVADMGEDTFVVSVGDQDAEAVIERLADDPGLNDAGFLYLAE